MDDAYKDDKALCRWLRENSSGAYRLAAFAAERIETLSTQLDNVQRECERLEFLIKPNASLDRPAASAGTVGGVVVPGDRR